MSYRSDVDALAARHAALENEVAATTKQLDDARRLLEEAKARAKLPVLDNIRVGTPCHVDWNGMTGDDRMRHCGSCDKRVYNISELTRDEAQALIIQHEGKLCVRYYRRHDGTIILKDCKVGIAAKRKRRVVAASVAALLAGGIAWLMSRKEAEGDAADITVQSPESSTVDVQIKAQDHTVKKQPQHRYIKAEPKDPEIIMGDML